MGINTFYPVFTYLVANLKFLISDSLSPSQFPVFTMYATKICISNAVRECSFPQSLTKRLKKKSPTTPALPRDVVFQGSSLTNSVKRSWSFDRVHHHQLIGFVRKRLRVKNARQGCMELCLSERKFICRYKLK